MDQLRNYGDTRQTGSCAYCGRATGTRDHVPSRVLLDEPYPTNLPVVPACDECNQSFSLDEQYVACLVECSRLGTSDPAVLERTKVGRILRENPALASRLRQATERDGGPVSPKVEPDRLERVVLKLAKGHALFELNEPMYDPPAHVSALAFHNLGPEERQTFETPPQVRILPEVGSRAMQRMIVAGSSVFSDWILVQPGRYRYLTTAAESETDIRIVMSEYLACQVTWGADG